MTSPHDTAFFSLCIQLHADRNRETPINSWRDTSSTVKNAEIQVYILGVYGQFTGNL